MATDTTRCSARPERRRAGARARRRLRRRLPPRRGQRGRALVGARWRRSRGAGEPPATFEAFLGCVHPDDRPALHAAVLATAPDGATSTRDLRVVWPDGSTHWLDARWRLVPEAQGRPTIVGIARQIDDERAALGRVRFLADVSAALDASLDMEDTLATIAELCVRDLGDWCSIDLTDADGELRNVAVAHVDPVKVELAQRMRERYPPRSRAGGGTAQVVRTGEPLLLAQISEEQMVAGARDAEHLELIRSLGLTSVLIVALRARGHVLGAITLARTGRHPDYDEDDVAFVGEVAGRAALALDNARLYGEARARERDVERGPGAARCARQCGADRPGLPRHRLPLRPRQRRAGRDQRRPGHRPHRAHGARGAARAGHRHRGRAGRRCWRPARRSSTCRSWARRRASPAATATTSPATTRCALARGERLGIGITVADVTDRAEAAQALREQRDLYEALMRAQSELGLAFVLLDGERIVYANAATEALTGRSARELYALPSILATLPLDVHRAVAGRLAACATAASRPSRFAPRSSAPTARASRSRPPAGGWAGRPTRAWRSSRATSPIAWPRSASCSGCSRSSRPRGARARPRTPACGCWPTRARCSSARRASDDALQEVAELLVARIADSCALDVLDLAGHLRRAGADARAPDGRRRHAGHGGRSGGRARDAGRSADLPRGPGRGTPCSGAARRSSRSWPTGGRSGCSRSAGATPGAGPRATSGASSRRSRSGSRSPSTERFSTASARTWPRRCRPACCPPRCPTSRARPWPRSTWPRARGWTSAATSTTSSPSTTGSWILVIGDVGQGRRGRGGHRAGPLHPARRGDRSPLAGGDAGGAQRRDAAPAQSRPALRHRRPRAPPARRGRRRASRRGLRRPPAAACCCARAASPRRCACPGTLLGVEPDARSFDRSSSWARGHRWCSTPTG